MNDVATPDVKDRAQGLLCPSSRVNHRHERASVDRNRLLPGL